MFQFLKNNQKCYQAYPLHPKNLIKKLQRYKELHALVSFFKKLDKQFSTRREIPNPFKHGWKKIHCPYKRNPFLKTAAKEKLPAGLLIWLVKPANVEMIIKWQRPRGPSIPNHRLQSRWQATQVPGGKSLFSRLASTKYTKLFTASSGYSIFQAIFPSWILNMDWKKWGWRRLHTLGLLD